MSETARYCVINGSGQYLSASLDLLSGINRPVWVASPWMAYLLDSEDDAQRLANDVGGTVATWTRPLPQNVRRFAPR